MYVMDLENDSDRMLKLKNLKIDEKSTLSFSPFLFFLNTFHLFLSLVLLVCDLFEFVYLRSKLFNLFYIIFNVIDELILFLFHLANCFF